MLNFDKLEMDKQEVYIAPVNGRKWVIKKNEKKFILQLSSECLEFPYLYEWHVKDVADAIIKATCIERFRKSLNKCYMVRNLNIASIFHDYIKDEYKPDSMFLYKIE